VDLPPIICLKADKGAIFLKDNKKGDN